MPSVTNGQAGYIWQQAGANAANTLLGIGAARLGANYDRKQQMKTQEQFMAMQLRANKEMLDYTNQKNLELYSPEAEKERLKKAGLNPALMYGMSGPGATTMASSGGVSAPGAGVIPTGTTGSGMGLNIAELQLAKAQIENIKANTNKTNVEATKIGGVDTQEAQTRIENLTQGIENQKVAKLLTEEQTKAIELANQITASTKYDQIAKVGAELEATIAHVRSGMAWADIDEQTKEDKIQIIKTSVIGATLENQLKEIGIQKTQEEITKIKQDVINSIRGLNLTEGGQRIEMRKAEITRILGEKGLSIAQQAVVISALDKVIGIIGNATK